MTENVLYFPYIRVPANPWFTRVLLYWDSVGSIVPYEYVNQPERLGTYMQALLTEGLVKQIIPEQYIYKVPNFVDSFIDSARRHKRRLKITKDSLSKLSTFRVHIEKLDDIGHKLCELGLARKADYPWYEIEARLANQFMAYLAGVLSILPDVKSTPITDERSHLNIYDTTGRYRSVILENLLPSPSEEVTAERLSHFKSKHQRELLKFRNEVESFILQVASVSDKRLRGEMVNRFMSKTKADIDGIVDAMASNGWAKISSGRFLSYAVAGTTLADAISTGGLLSTIAAAFGVAASAYTTYEGSKLPDGLKNSFSAYAALATKL